VLGAGRYRRPVRRDDYFGHGRSDLVDIANSELVTAAP
jgi:hypothetical protein